ncbi:MAG: hypothetical protein GXO79_15485 [Chlorobi bacterium]|nr:hypothetical protein [Chlorobiota bacterium]
MKNIIILALSIFLSVSTFAQKEETKNKKEEKPVRSPFNSSLVINNQTVIQPSKGYLEFIIYHRMSGMDKGISNLYGFYGASNIHLALQYGITNKLMLGFGSEKYSKMQELYWKYKIIQQTRSGSIPVSISYYGNLVIDARDTSNFGSGYKFTNRFSYFNQFIISRKFNKKLSTQFSVAYAHFNAVEEGWYNDIIGTSISGRYKIHNDISAIFEYNLPIPYKETTKKSKPGFGFGVEIATSTHTFQIFVSQYDEIIPQKNYVFNENEFSKEGIGFGFNVHVKF